VVLVTSVSFESSTIGVEVVVITDSQHVEFIDSRNQGTMKRLAPLLLYWARIWNWQTDHSLFGFSYEIYPD